VTTIPWPSIGVVVPTRKRPEELSRAVSAVLAQKYPKTLDVVVVYDGVPVDESLSGRGIRAIPNARTPGLPGARNTGILALDTDLVAFCDDDDEWLPGKLRAQIEALAAAHADFATASVRVAYDGAETVRLAGTELVTHERLVRSRMSMLHSSSFVVRRVFLNEIGLVDEDIPGGQNEDWDLLLRASAVRPIVHVDAPLVRVSWSHASHFSRDWETKIASLRWMLERHPEISGDQAAAARVFGQIAFAHAARGDARQAVRWSLRGLRKRPLEPRPYLALAVAGRLTTSDVVLDRLHRRGRGV
jgi:glycosyltransferase involved in cell wall biosynthesis